MLLRDRAQAASRNIRPIRAESGADDTLRNIPLTQGKVSLVDDADYEWLSKFKWCAWRGNRNSQNGLPLFYAVRKESGRIVRMHNIVFGRLGIDHIDGNGLNNQRYNLRPASQAENVYNRRPQCNNRSGYKGVCVHNRPSHTYYVAQIMSNGENKYIGHYKVAEDAARAYDAEAIAAFGKYAWLNFPNRRD